MRIMEVNEIIEKLKEMLTNIASLEVNTPFRAVCQRNALEFISLAIKNLKKVGEK